MRPETGLGCVRQMMPSLNLDFASKLFVMLLLLTIVKTPGVEVLILYLVIGQVSLSVLCLDYISPNPTPQSW